MKKYIKCVCTALCAMLAMVFVLSGCAGGKAKEKEFSKAGMTIVLTEEFKEQDIVTQTATYATAQYLVVALKEEFTLFENAGISPNISLEEYAKLVLKNNGIEAPIENKEGLTCFKYEKEVSGKNMTYFAVVQKGADAFWLIQFACETKVYGKAEPQFKKWAKTVKV